MYIIAFVQDIFRKYPNKYESIIATLCENLDTLDEPEARYFETQKRHLFTITIRQCCINKSAC
jgi:hypothetical protein